MNEFSIYINEELERLKLIYDLKTDEGIQKIKKNYKNRYFQFNLKIV